MTVLDAIEVEDKFKIAIETAMGEVQSYWYEAVDAADQADNLIKFSLRKKGKVTFILNRSS